jgi:Glyoxalase/Bleomycin resistance protein/Dioxygenase superfamily
MAKITGVGGVFFKSTATALYWQRGIASTWACRFKTLAALSSNGRTTRPTIKALLCGKSRRKTASGFSPSKSSFMINYRVDNLGELLEQLRAAGVEVIQGPESHENGKFAWIMDPDENKIELWEPKAWDDKNKGA